MFKSLSLILMSFTISANAGSMKPNAPAPGGVSLRSIEERVGHSLNQDQKLALRNFIAEQKPAGVWQVSEPVVRRAICFGGSAAMVGEIARALCVGARPWRLYDLVFMGVGFTLELQASAFYAYASVNDPSRYDENFDPLPGDYGYARMGLTLLLGAHSLQATSGNKILELTSVNIGLAGDMLSGGWIHIE
jgi:hypothetical protein